MPLSLVNCWLSPSNDGTCKESIEYELEKEHITLYDVIISITLLCVSGNVFFTYSDALDCQFLVMVPTPPLHRIQSLDPASHSLDWSSQLSLQPTTANPVR